ncbi:MAG: alpha/beta fold hydrolase [Proteobacteria bacterium]|nr:alpha/beta fold hydrolase [Pseudomonadota bacterium]
MSEITDRALHAALAKLTLGLSPAAVLSAQLHWLVHLATSPGKRFQLADKAMRKLLRYQTYAWRNLLEPGKVPPVIEPLPQDRRFRGEAWQQWPYNLVQQGFLLQQQWWHNATSGVRGVTRHHEAMVEFGARQLLDLFSPSNFLATNPELQQRTLETGGRNLVEGLQHLFEDWERMVNGRRPAGSEAYVVGGNVAATPGKVVFRNGLMELIQYEATTSSVRPEPLLIVPAWIMKYYILDLSSENSLIRYLTGQGFTVFAISWKNPTARDRDVGFDDYRGQGVMAAIDAIGAIVPGRQVHALGYCLGGTLLSIAAAAMARQGDNRLSSVTLLAAQVDFTEAGELMLFIDEGQVSFLEDMMWEQGFLDAKQMSGAFQLLRSNDLIWSKGLHRYLMGERDEMNDMMAWNADATRLPYRMHSEYLRQLFLNNDLAEGRYAAGGRTVMLADIRAPMFVVGTVHDHVAPWRSVYKIHHLVDAPVTFVLASGGHNAGIVAPIDRPGPWHQVMTHAVDARHLDSETWAVTAPQRDGSWWTTYAAWLAAHSGPPVAPPPLGNAAAGYVVLGDAPGTYVLEE